MVSVAWGLGSGRLGWDGQAVLNEKGWRNGTVTSFILNCGDCCAVEWRDRATGKEDRRSACRELGPDWGSADSQAQEVKTGQWVFSQEEGPRNASIDNENKNIKFTVPS